MRKILNLLTVAFIVLKFRGDEPFNSWTWWLILTPFFISKILDLIVWFYREFMSKKIDGEIELLKYDFRVKKAVNEARRDIKNAKK